MRKGQLPSSQERDKRDRGVKFCQVVAAVAKVPETHHNLSVLLDKMQVLMFHSYVPLEVYFLSER